MVTYFVQCNLQLLKRKHCYYYLFYDYVEFLESCRVNIEVNKLSHKITTVPEVSNRI